MYFSGSVFASKVRMILSAYKCVCVCLCRFVACVQGVGVYIEEHVFESGSAYTDKWEECLGRQRGVCWSTGASLFGTLSSV